MFAKLSIQVWMYIFAALATAGAIYGVYAYVKHQGYQEHVQEIAKEDARRLSVQMDHTLDEIEKNSKLSFDLARFRQENAQLRSNHVQAASVIVGTCPASLWLLHDASASGSLLPDPLGGPPSAAPALNDGVVSKGVPTGEGRAGGG